jgi:Uma2 family endonuclease
MVRAYVFESDSRLELIHGEIMERVEAQYPPHASTTCRLTTTLISRLGSRAEVRCQSPITLSTDCEPRPDIVACKPDPNWYSKRHPEPTDAYLVVEIADSTLVEDRRKKLKLYARAGIGEVWLVDLMDGSVTVHRNPRKGKYSKISVVHRGNTIAPIAFPDKWFSLNEFLPPTDVA